MGLIELVNDTKTQVIKFYMDNKPDILLGAGIAGSVGAVIASAVASYKVPKALENALADITAVRERKELIGEDYTAMDNKKELTAAYAKCAWNVGKLYIPAVVLETAGIGAIVSSHKEMEARNLSLAAACSTVTAMFDNYRKNVREVLGEDVDRDMRASARQEVEDKKIVDDKGKTRTVKNKFKSTRFAEMNLSDYARIFGSQEYCETNNCEFSKEYEANMPEYNMMFLKSVEENANRVLISRYSSTYKRPGWLFLNEVYEMLGYPPTIAGQSVGWIYDPENPVGDNFVSFGLYEYWNKNAVNGIEECVILDFNVDGPILGGNRPILKDI